MSDKAEAMGDPNARGLDAALPRGDGRFALSERPGDRPAENWRIDRHVVALRRQWWPGVRGGGSDGGR
jgi:hypothetical protein